MKKLTNLQMSIIADKIYRELSAKIDPINVARLEAIDVDKLLKKDKTIPLLRAYQELTAKEEALRKEKESLKYDLQKVYSEYSHYSVPTPEDYIRRIRYKEYKPIVIDRQDIEANVILSDVTDLDTLIENITRSITKDIPELN